MFTNFRESVSDIGEDAKDYFEATVDYYKLSAFKVLTKSISVALKVLIVGLFLSIFIILGSVALAIALGNLLDSMVYGFLIVAGVYLILSALLIFFKSKALQAGIIKLFSKIYFSK